MKKMNQAVSVLLTAVLLCGILSISASASTISSNFLTLTDGTKSYTISGRDLNSTTREITLTPKSGAKIANSFTVKTINQSQVPKGITPVVCQSQAEADAYLAQIVYEANAEQGTLSAAAAKMIIPPKTITLAKNVTYKKVNFYSYRAAVLGRLKFNLTYSATSAGIITYASPSTELTGLVLGVEWTVKKTSAVLDSTKKKVTVTTVGKLDYYTFIRGTIKVYTQEVTFKGTGVT